MGIHCVFQRFYGFRTALFIRPRVWLLSFVHTHACMVLSMVHTNLLVWEGLFLYAIATKGGLEKSSLKVLLFQISFQCFCVCLISLCVSTLNCVTQTFFGTEYVL